MYVCDWGNDNITNATGCCAMCVPPAAYVYKYTKKEDVVG